MAEKTTIVDIATKEGLHARHQINELCKLTVKVGFPAGGATYKDEETGEEELSVAEVAAFNEFGTSDGRTPARPFLSNSIDLHEEEITKFAEKLFKQLCKGRLDAKELMQKLGVFQKGVVQKEIVDGTYAPNSPYTIKKKGSDHPLIDTGLMRQSVTFIVQGKKGNSTEPEKANKEETAVRDEV